MKVYIKNKLISITGKSFVTDISGKSVYNVKGRAFSPTKVKKVCALDGKLLYKVRNRWLNIIIHSSFIYDANNKRIAKVKNRFFSPGYDIEIDGATYSIEGKWFSFESKIVRNGQVIGIVRRQLSLVSDSFELETDEANMPFMIAFVIAMDNICDNARK